MSYLAKAQGTFINLPPAGASTTFLMGSPMSNKSAHREITLTPFAMQETLVTVRQFSAYVEEGEKLGLHYGRFMYGPTGHVASVIWGDSEQAVANKSVTLDAGCSFASVSPIRKLIPTMDEYMGRLASLADGGKQFMQLDHPAVMIDWYEAAAFAFSIGGRLPTEAEHMFATGAGRAKVDTAEYGAEEKPSGLDYLATGPVKSHLPNPWGLYDMGGNACVWTQSWSGPMNAMSANDPVGPLDGESRVVCTGLWRLVDLLYFLATYPRLIAHYHAPNPENHYENIGLRVVRPQNS